MPGDNDFDNPTPAGLIAQELWDMLEACAVNGTANLPGEVLPRSSANILAAVADDPAKYNIPKVIGAAVGGAAAGLIVADVCAAIAFLPVTVLAGILLPIFSADDRVVKLMVLNGMDQDLVRESASVMTHGQQTGHPVLQVVDTVTGAIKSSTDNVIPAARMTTVVHPGQPAKQAKVYGMGLYEFQKSQMSLGAINFAFAFYGVEGGLSFKLADGSRTGISIAFMVPENGANAQAVCLDNATHYQDLTQFIAKTVSSDKSITREEGVGMQIWSSMLPRDFPNSQSTIDVVMTVAILPK